MGPAGMTITAGALDQRHWVAPRVRL